jgi:hypothetical protein
MVKKMVFVSKSHKLRYWLQYLLVQIGYLLDIPVAWFTPLGSKSSRWRGRRADVLFSSLAAASGFPVFEPCWIRHLFDGFFRDDVVVMTSSLLSHFF